MESSFDTNLTSVFYLPQQLDSNDISASCSWDPSWEIYNNYFYKDVLHNNSFAAIVDIDDNVVSFLLFSNLIAYENHFDIDVFLAKYHAIVDNHESLILIDSYDNFAYNDDLHGTLSFFNTNLDGLLFFKCLEKFLYDTDVAHPAHLGFGCIYIDDCDFGTFAPMTVVFDNSNIINLVDNGLMSELEFDDFYNEIALFKVDFEKETQHLCCSICGEPSYFIHN